MAFTIERWTDKAWRIFRHDLLRPNHFARKCQAQIALRRLPRGRYRIAQTTTKDKRQ